MRGEYLEGVPLCWTLTGPEAREMLPEINVIHTLETQVHVESNALGQRGPRLACLDMISVPMMASEVTKRLPPGCLA